MDLRQVECFLKVAEHLHFGKAAEELFLGQPAVSEAIRRLERELGGNVFDRTTRRVTLTALGESFRADAEAAYRAMVHAYADAQAVARQESQELVVGTTGDFGDPLVKAVTALQRRSPGVIVTLRTLSTPRQVQALRDRKLHVGICWAPESTRDEFASTALERCRLVAILPVGHPLATQASIRVDDLTTEPLIVWERAANPRIYDELAEAMGRTGEPWTYVGTASGIENVAARVLSGFGIGIMFESFAPSRRIEGVVIVPIELPLADLDRVVLWRANDRHPALAPFVETVVRTSRAVPA
jgi:DNA-binding transcriptional LysR family regulator